MNADLSSDELRDLQVLFFRELEGMFSEANAARARLVENPNDTAAWDTLRRFFHRLSGSAPAAEIEVLGRLGAACEGVCDLVTQGELPATPAAVRLLSEGILGAAAALRERQPQLRPSLDSLGEAFGESQFKPEAGEGGKVLVVDDDPVGAKLTVDILRKAGFDCRVVADSTRALDTIFLERPDLLILDVVMPVVDGFELCRQVRANTALAFTPILFLTRKDDLAQRVQGLEVGGNDYIAKPFEPRELVARVRSHLSRLAALREMAIRDGLTRCYNHKYFKARMEQELARGRRYQTGLSVALIDIDFFKQVNDRYGHPTGDSVLAHLSHLITASVRSTDVVARYGGEEFGVLLVQAGVAEAKIILQRMRQRIEDHRFIAVAAESPSLEVTVSLGVTEARDDDTAQTLLARADQALYAAKQGGRNRVEVAAA